MNDPELSIFLPFIDQHNLPVEVILSLIDGLIMDQDMVALKTQRLGSLWLSCGGNCWGVDVLYLNCRDQEAYPYAIDLGIAMQLTNIGMSWKMRKWGGDTCPQNGSRHEHECY